MRARRALESTVAVRITQYMYVVEVKSGLIIFRRPSIHIASWRTTNAPVVQIIPRFGFRFAQRTPRR